MNSIIYEIFIVFVILNIYMLSFMNITRLSKNHFYTHDTSL